MRIAVTGAHGVGKTTLVEDLAAHFRDYEVIPEPYWLLTEEGVPFADGPTTADLETQLERSCALILAGGESEGNLVFDRCPLDFMAYLDVISAQEGYEWFPSGKLLSRVEKALQALDLVVFVPLMRLDDIGIAIEYPKLRAKVDARLKSILRQDDLGLMQSVRRVLEVSGAREQRVQKLAAALNAGPGSL